MSAVIHAIELLTVMAAAPFSAGAACPPLLDARMETLMHGETPLCQFGGKVLAFPSGVAPEDRKLVAEIERLLAQP